MRADFRDVAQVFSGPSAVPPAVLKQTVDCRFVPNSRTLLYVPSAFRFLAYVNYVGLSTSAGAQAIVGSDVTIDLDFADRWEFDFAPGTFWIVVGAALINPPQGGPYRRAWLILE